MSFGHNCWFRSSQCNIREIMEILMNILASFFIQPLFCVLNFYFGSFHQKFDEIFSNYVILSESSLINSRNLLQKQLHFRFFSCKNRICHHKFKLDGINNDWTKKEAKIFIRISVISRILHWLDCNRQLSPWEAHVVPNLLKQ